MSSVKFVSFIMFVSIGLTLLFGIAQLDTNTFIGNESELNQLMESTALNESEELSFNLLSTGKNFFVTATRVTTWNYSFFEGDWGYVRFILAPLTFSFFFVLMVTVVPVIISSIVAFRNLFRA